MSQFKGSQVEGVSSSGRVSLELAPADAPSARPPEGRGTAPREATCLPQAKHGKQQEERRLCLCSCMCVCDIYTLW